MLIFSVVQGNRRIEHRPSLFYSTFLPLFLGNKRKHIEEKYTASIRKKRMNRVNAALVQYSSGTIIPQTHGPADRAKSIPRVYGSKNKDAAFNDEEVCVALLFL